MLQNQIFFPSITARTEVSQLTVQDLNSKPIRQCYVSCTAFGLVVFYPPF